ncbi:MAG: DNA polymerase Y family protein [Rhizobiales bacterium]|nr:DNA polymerase Y family protein [Hyphomicrobiales bacterium]
MSAISRVETGPSQRRYLAVWLPFLPADRWRRFNPSVAPDDLPLVFTDKVRGALRLAAVDRRAQALGLAAGLTLADARARVPDILAIESDPAADAAFMMRLGEACDRYTPLVAFDPPDGLTLDVTGCAHLFGGEAALRTDLGARLAGIAVQGRASIAGTPEAARALARFGRLAIVAPGGEAAAVEPLPVAALGLPAETVLALSRAGLKTIGDLAARPSAPLAARFGAALTAQLGRVLGLEDIRITPRRPVPACIVERRFAEPIARAEDIQGTLALLMAKAGALLEQRGEGGRAFEASFFRTDGAVRRIAVETGRPTRDPRAVMRLFAERLEALADPIDPGFGFDLIRLSVPATEPFAVAQNSLDGHAVEDDEMAELIDRLVARFGTDRVLRFAARDSHDPDRAAHLVPALGAAAEQVAWRQAEADEPPARPLHVFDPPQPIEAIAEVPDGPPMSFLWRRCRHDVTRAEGPERIAAEWWRQADRPARDYYRVEDSDGRRFWLFRSGFYGGAASPRWFLHGLFA